MSVKKNVLINQATGYLFRDAANEISEFYDDVTLMTGIEIDPEELRSRFSANSAQKIRDHSVGGDFR